MPYNYRGTGYLSDAVQIPSSRVSYLIGGRTSGFSGGQVEIGYDNFGTRVFSDNGIIESYACANEKILDYPTANVGRQLFDLYNTRVVAASGSTEARDCTINELYDLKQE